MRRWRLVAIYICICTYNVYDRQNDDDDDGNDKNGHPLFRMTKKRNDFV